MAVVYCLTQDFGIACTQYLRSFLCTNLQMFVSYCQYMNNTQNVCNLKLNKKFWEELIAHSLFAVILESDTTSRKKTVVCVRNKVNKTTQFWWLHC
jgi:hypothetical protein